MPDDPFRDLSRSRAPAERLAELDEEPQERPSTEAPPPARPGGRYVWVVGVVALIAIAVATFNSLVGVGPGEGVSGPPTGEPLPDFAAPSASGQSEADANIRQEDGGTDEEGPVPACEVEGPDVVNICELRRRPVVLTFVLEGCEAALDEVERVRDDYPRVAFVGVLGEERAVVEELLGQRRWGFPVALDPDNAVLNLYRVGDCPTTVFAEEGGAVARTELGYLSEEELRDGIGDLLGHGRSGA